MYPFNDPNLTPNPHSHQNKRPEVSSDTPSVPGPEPKRMRMMPSEGPTTETDEQPVTAATYPSSINAETNTVQSDEVAGADGGQGIEEMEELRRLVERNQNLDVQVQQMRSQIAGLRQVKAGLLDRRWEELNVRSKLLDRKAELLSEYAVINAEMKVARCLRVLDQHWVEKKHAL